MDLSLRMASWRHAKGIGQTAIAKVVGVYSSAVSMWESGAARPTVENLERYVVKGLGETMARFYDDAALAAATAKGERARATATKRAVALKARSA